MRLQNFGTTVESAQISEFLEWITNTGDGKIGGPNDGCTTIEIPDDILLKGYDNPIAAIVESTYLKFNNIADDPNYLQGRAILAPTFDAVEAINEYMTSLNPSEGKIYLSSDSTSKLDSNVDLLSDLHTLEFLNVIKCSSVPNHQLHLKVETLVMLLRNIDHSIGLCNGTRLVITRLGSHVLEAKVLSQNSVGDRVLIPGMTLTPSNIRISFKFQRRRYPLIVSYAMTINKSQG